MTTTLEHHYYHQPEVFDYESEHIFKRHWWLVTTEAAFAENGDYQTFKLMQWPLLVVLESFISFKQEASNHLEIASEENN